MALLDGSSARGEDAPTLTARHDGDAVRLAASGRWTLETVRRGEQATAKALKEAGRPVRATVVLDGVNELDTAGAILLDDLLHKLAGAGAATGFEGGTTPHAKLAAHVAARHQDLPAPTPRGNAIVDLLADIGRTMVNVGGDVVGVTSFLGAVVSALGRVAVRPWRFRATSFVHHMELVGLRAVPIIALISLLVGAIVAQQGIFYFRSFGATAYVVDLIGVLALRELGVLLTAIMIAGRSGSAFTAELGSMKMREEIDALRVMGLDPVEILVLPRILALIVGMTILSFIASMSTVLGGGLVAWLYGGITPDAFLARLKAAIVLSTFVVGVVKAPFMGLIIGLIATVEGLRVEGSAESLGRQTTSSVVKAIFMVIVVDGLFAMFFAQVGY